MYNMQVHINVNIYTYKCKIYRAYSISNFYSLRKRKVVCKCP